MSLPSIYNKPKNQYRNSKLNINGQPFNKCQIIDGKPDPMCLHTIYASNEYGLSSSQYMPLSILYTDAEGEYITNPKTSQIYDHQDSKSCGLYGCCADGTVKADRDGKNCAPFTKESRLVGDPRMKYSALGGINQTVGISKVSGDSYTGWPIESFVDGNERGIMIGIILVVLFLVNYL